MFCIEGNFQKNCCELLTINNSISIEGIPTFQSIIHSEYHSEFLHEKHRNAKFSSFVKISCCTVLYPKKCDEQ